MRRERLDHVLVLDDQQLRRILTACFASYHRTRTHLALDKDAPDLRPVQLITTDTILSALHPWPVRQDASGCFGRVGRGFGEGRPSWLARAAFARPVAQRMLGRLLAIGARPEHVQPLKPQTLRPAA